MSGNFKRVTKRPFQEIIRDNICRWCGKLERERGLSLKQIAEGLGITAAALSQWRTGETIPNGANLENFAIFCRIPLRCLLCDFDDTRCTTCKYPKPEPCPHSDGYCFNHTPPPKPSSPTN